MTETSITRDEWVAAKPVRNPEVEQVLFGGDVPAADELALGDINPYNPYLFRDDRWHDHFARLRRESPVHLNELGSAGRYWSITRWEDVRAVDGDWKSFSSSKGIVLSPPVGVAEANGIDQFTSFITMDPPQQTEQRGTVRGISAPSHLRDIETMIRERTATLLDSLPEGETFDWVETVSVELTTLMLATLFGFPMEDRRLLTRWSDAITTTPEPGGVIETRAEQRAEMMACVDYFSELWVERQQNPGFDLVSMLANGEATKDTPVLGHLGNLMLLIVGGNDTTRNTMSGSVYALDRYPDQFAKLAADPGLIENLIPEVIRWQTPLSYMRRTANHDCEVAGTPIRADDQLLLWYISANRDEEVFGPDADVLDIERPNADRHLSFGYGVHFCMGSRIAELQLRILWEEVLPRFERIEVLDEPSRTFSTFVHGYTHMPVRVTRK
ncbi:MAG: cytochrome P450 [Actinomycetota bacterium]